ncbi:MAG TPA: DUF3237 family protein [Sphingobium sp.]|nr:DUF3237 family protein [Sphingobium sp.]
MTEPLDAPTPGFAHAFDMIVEHGAPMEIGVIATGGARRYRPVTGGTLAGEGLCGQLTGGGEMLLERADGATMVEASYYIRFADGAVARCFGTGYHTPDGPFVGTRLSLLFEAAEGSSVAALATRAFVGEQADGNPLLSISRII